MLVAAWHSLLVAAWHSLLLCVSLYRVQSCLIEFSLVKSCTLAGALRHCAI